ncbi:MAG: hypothetical protein AAF824_09720 [Bacteroidota bacterium]
MMTRETLCRSIICVLAIAFFSVLSAQNNTSSPYSSLGIGDITAIGLGPLQGMGGTGIALSPTSYYNYTNPAGNNALPEKASLTDIGLFYQYTSGADAEITQKTQDFNLSYFSLVFSPKPDYTLSFGLKPYSSIGYDIDIQSDIEGSTEAYQSRYTGSGGVNQVFWSNAFQIDERLSLGATFSFMWGQISTEETLSLGTSSSNLVNSEFTYNVISLKADVGIQYKIPLSDKNHLKLGAVIEQPFGTRGTYSEFIVSSGQIGSGTEPEFEEIPDLRLPLSWGLGVGLSLEDKWNIGVDIYRQNWSEAILWDGSEDLSNSLRISTGVEYAPQPKSFGKKRPPILRAGLSYTDSYLEIRQVPIEEYGISAGIGFPFRGAGGITLSYEYQIRGTQQEGLIEEQSHVISLSATLPDLWFRKRQID